MRMNRCSRAPIEGNGETQGRRSGTRGVPKAANLPPVVAVRLPRRAHLCLSGPARRWPSGRRAALPVEPSSKITMPLWTLPLIRRMMTSSTTIFRLCRRRRLGRTRDAEGKRRLRRLRRLLGEAVMWRPCRRPVRDSLCLLGVGSNRRSAARRARSTAAELCTATCCTLCRRRSTDRASRAAASSAAAAPLLPPRSRVGALRPPLRAVARRGLRVFIPHRLPLPLLGSSRRTGDGEPERIVWEAT
mmetsp:Transcript_56314/g.182894  ORF Transcript_56314/g.182894 Transcript_56314/m.182894 type:complete len:245 (+) Transcript_56314:1502-2236(+)